jgi:hypothetical protein
MTNAPTVPGWPVVFRGSLAIAAGLLTPGRLRGQEFRRLLPDIYTPTRDEPPNRLLPPFDPVTMATVVRRGTR